MNKLLVILGPTATGKTDLAIRLAKKLNGELIACDSRQLYKGLDIGTGKEPNQKSQIKKHNRFWEIGGVKVWMYDVVSPKKQYDVSRFIKDSQGVLNDLFSREKLPIIVGGTGLYLKGLLEGFSNINIPENKELRRELSSLTIKQLQRKLESLSPTAFAKLNNSDQKNPRRLIRSIELVVMYPYSSKPEFSNSKFQGFNVLKIGLTAPRPALNARIDSRILSRLDQGMIEEAENLHKHGLSLKRMNELGLEYGLLAELITKQITRAEFIIKLQTKIHQYAKRQLTWFRRDSQIHWFDVTYKNWDQKVEKQVIAWYNSPVVLHKVEQ